MPENNKSRGNIYSANDTLDINELASLNDDITPEFIEQLQNQVAQNASEFIGRPLENTADDSKLFEEIQPDNDNKTEIKKSNEQEDINSTNPPSINEDVDDNYVKKYKAKLDKEEARMSISVTDDNVNTKETSKTTVETAINNEQIEQLTSGNIVEKPIDQSQIEYNESLDLIDDNIKYSKYVIYVDPENTEFIESLTVKERKNLINRILREQDDIAITKKRLGLVQTVIKHVVIAIITISISIPLVYVTINASLEASINNYKRSKTIFKTLYKEKGKIKKQVHY